MNRMMIFRTILPLIGALLLFAGCTTVPRRGATPSNHAPAGTWNETGLASWYGGKFAGRPTASGRIFNPKELTAAHKTLPFGSIVKVTNLKNKKQVVVEVTDRGPFVKGRIIDLSERAAREIGMIAAGTAPVELRLLRRKR